MNPFDRCASCGGGTDDHRHEAKCWNGNQSKHHDFRLDVPRIAVELRRIAPLLEKSEAYDLVAALAAPSVPPEETRP